MSVPSRYSTTATILSPTCAGRGVPTALSAASLKPEMSATGRPAAIRRSLRSLRRGLTAIPQSVTTTSTDSPGVVAVSTSSVIVVSHRSGEVVGVEGRHQARLEVPNHRRVHREVGAQGHLETLHTQFGR